MNAETHGPEGVSICGPQCSSVSRTAQRPTMALNVDVAAGRYRAMIGVGGIGTGVFFAVSGNHTLGREESRLGRFLDRRDYCKLHIISHYVSTLLGPGFTTLPVGKVGDDEAGTRLLEEMRQAGMVTRYVQVCPGKPTLSGICIVYPDGSGGNLTTEDSACAQVDPAYVAAVEPEFARFRGHGIVLAAPEVPLVARKETLRLGTVYGFLRVASFNSQEIVIADNAGMLSTVDLLAINADEAAALAGVEAEKRRPDEIAWAAVERLRATNPGMLLSVTAGRHGSWSWDGHDLAHVPALPVPVASTAGAGDAHLAGIIVGLAAGLPLAEAHYLGALVAALSVTSPHTINKDINRESLLRLAREVAQPLPARVMSLLE